LESRVKPLDCVGRWREVRDPLQHRVVARARELLDLGARGPDRGGAAAGDGGGFAVGIDAALEQLLKARVDEGAAEAAPQECQNAERRQMSLVEDDRVAQGNRS